MVAVRFRDRPWAAVLADLVEGVVVANGLRGTHADDARAALWAAAQAASLVPGPMPLPSPTTAPASRGQARRVARRPSLHAVPGGGPSVHDAA